MAPTTVASSGSGAPGRALPKKNDVMDSSGAGASLRLRSNSNTPGPSRARPPTSLRASFTPATDYGRGIEATITENEAVPSMTAVTATLTS